MFSAPQQALADTPASSRRWRERREPVRLDRLVCETVG
jgi:hypothetical protein